MTIKMSESVTLFNHFLVIDGPQVGSHPKFSLLNTHVHC